MDVPSRLYGDVDDHTTSSQRNQQMNSGQTMRDTTAFPNQGHLSLKPNWFTPFIAETGTITTT